MNTEHPIIVIHHSADFDGLFCREIARRHFGERAQYIGWDYGQPEPVVPPEARLVMLDISVAGLMEHPNLIWIDHHRSAMSKYGSKPGAQIDGVAACRIAWQWFFAATPYGPGGAMPTKEDFVGRSVTEPWAVRLAGEYDIWDPRDPNAELFQHGLRSCDLHETHMWEGLLSTDGELDGKCVQMLLENGAAVKYAKDQENADIITSYGFDVEWEGLRFLACNHARFNSHLFNAGLQPHHQALLGFKWDGQLARWRVSLYHAPGHEAHDLSAIAVKYGGGGHRGACGFERATLPFLP